MPTARKQVRSGSEASINATQLHRPNFTLSLSFEILERIGMKIDSLAAVGIWNSVLATRHRGLMRLVDGLPHLTYANVEPMIHIDVIHGTRYTHFQHTGQYIAGTEPKEDRDVLVLCLKPNSTVDATLIYTVCMMYPFRIHGPIIINDTMHIEFLNYGHDVLANTTDFDATAWNVQFPIARQQKRRHDATTGDNSSADPNAAAINTDQLRSTLLEAIANTNTARIHVEKTGTGIDRQGPWISFELSSCDRLNLDFMGKFQTSANNSSIKVQWWMAIAKREISAQHALLFEISVCIYKCWHVCFDALLRLYCCINTHTCTHA